MPCNTIQTAQIELGKMEPSLFVKALEELGLHPRLSQNGERIGFDNGSFHIPTGKATLQLRGSFYGKTEDEILAGFKVAYSKQIVFSQAKKFGWQMKEIAQNKWEVVRR